MKNYVLCWDLETADKIEDQVGRFREDKIRRLTVSCACTLKLDSDLILEGKEDQAYREAVSTTFWIDDPEALEPLLQQFDDAELIVGFNTNAFDNIVMSQYYNGNRARELQHTFKAHDVFRKIIDAQARRWPKLDRLLELNGESPKTANGLQAIAWWAEGNRQDLELYCKADVSLMTRLCLRRDGIALDGGEPLRAPASLVGVAPALAARRFSFPEPVHKREREESEESEEKASPTAKLQQDRGTVPVPL